MVQRHQALVPRRLDNAVHRKNRWITLDITIKWIAFEQPGSDVQNAHYSLRVARGMERMFGGARVHNPPQALRFTFTYLSLC